MQITHEQHDGFEQVVAFQDDDFQCFIALHNTKLGPGLGGCRLKPYASAEDARQDALRLSRAMTYKSSLAGLDFGGGKCVIIADRATREIMLKFGEAVNYFGGDYIAGEDVGTTLADIAISGEVTPHINRIDGSEMTARGVLIGMTAALLYSGEWGETLDGVPIWVQGLGKVGMTLTTNLAKLDYPNLWVSDLHADRIRQACLLGAEEINEHERKFIAIYAPCAVGQVINAGNVHTMTYTIICGAANNQLVDDAYAELLRNNHVLYCPDYLVNAGGVISGACEIGQPYDKTKAEQMTDEIGVRLLDVLAMADQEKITPLAAADRLAEARFA